MYMYKILNEFFGITGALYAKTLNYIEVWLNVHTSVYRPLTLSESKYQVKQITVIMVCGNNCHKLRISNTLIW